MAQQDYPHWTWEAWAANVAQQAESQRGKSAQGYRRNPVTFTQREMARLRFLRWMVQNNRLTP